jgi:hypothetical protein
MPRSNGRSAVTWRRPASGGGAGWRHGRCRSRRWAWRSGWPTHPAPGQSRGSPPSRWARSSPWPVSSRTLPGGRSASGATASGPPRLCSAASPSASRHATPGGYCKAVALKPHLTRYWVTPATTEPDGQRDARSADVWEVYRLAPERAARGERTLSTDEMTSVQALERAAPGLRGQPGKGARRECEYVRHGTRSCLINFDVASGQWPVARWWLPRVVRRGRRRTARPMCSRRSRVTRPRGDGTAWWTL